MKKLSTFLLSVILLASCTKEAINAPETSQAASPVFFKDANIAVSNFTLTQTGDAAVEVKYSTLYENNVAKIELMSGKDANSFCAIEVYEPKANSNSEKQYKFEDANLKGETMFYMLRFTYSNGEWSYSGYKTINVN